MDTEQKIGKKFYKKWWFWVLAVFVLFVIGSSAEPTPSKVTETTDDSVETEQTEQKKAVYTVGESIELGDSVVTVNEVQVSQGGQFSSPQPGNEWLNLNITIQNTDNSQQYVTTLGQMFVRDAEGNSYQVAVTDKVMESPNNSLDGAIIANSKRSGWVGFEVPEGATGLQYQYNGSMWGGGTVLVDLE